MVLVKAHVAAPLLQQWARGQAAHTGRSATLVVPPVVSPPLSDSSQQLMSTHRLVFGIRNSFFGVRVTHDTVSARKTAELEKNTAEVGLFCGVVSSVG